MALKVKKQIKQNDGTIIEIEGTEAEVEAFEKKHEKKQQSEQTRKKRELLLDSSLPLSRMTKEDLVKIIREEVSKVSPSEHHHWHFNNGWWWRPVYSGGGLTITYQYTNKDPAINPSETWCSTTNAAEVSQLVGTPVSEIIPSISSTMSGYLSVTNGSWSGNTIVTS